jgi:hypothetical protein
MGKKMKNKANGQLYGRGGAEKGEKQSQRPTVTAETLEKKGRDKANGKL